MISPKRFYDALVKRGIDFFVGVPDSLLKNFCAYVQDNAPRRGHIIAANEGGALALAAGHYLASGRPALVYMQNSGIGNAVNPLLSLTDPAVYSIPALLVIGWRGEPGVKDAPQHVRQGELTPALLDALEIGYTVVSGDSDLDKALDSALAGMKEAGKPYALVIRKGAFEPYKLRTCEPVDAEMEREEAIRVVGSTIGPDAFIVSTTGKISRELYEFRKSAGGRHDHDFLTVGSMGHCSQIAAGVAITRPDRQIYCFDGDGAVIMHMGSLCIIGTSGLENFKHIIFNNMCHDSVGGQPTAGNIVDFASVARSCGYKTAERVIARKDLEAAVIRLRDAAGPALLEIRVKRGAREDLGRPKEKPVEMKINFMESI
jgi:phosphonopyruvate decarboxylase